MTIALIGFRGTGKSTVARAVADRLQWDVFDSDELLEARTGCTIQELFERYGEAHFRQLEAELLQELVKRSCAVLSLGGGIVLRPENRQLLSQIATVWLRAGAEIVHQRLAADPHTVRRRPALTALSARDEIQQLLKQREPLYAECAWLSIDTSDASVDQVADAIARWWQAGAQIRHPAVR